MTDQDKEKFASLGIKITRLKLESEMELIQDKLSSLQQLCTHPSKVVKTKQDTDEYGKACGKNIHIYSCPDCDKYWIEGEE